MSTSQHRIRHVLADVVDRGSELAVVPSFASTGIALRRRLERWTDPPSMSGRVVVVTGATSGIGLATATGLAKLGATVHLVGRHPGRATAAQAEVEAAGPGTARLDLVDMADPEAVAAFGSRLIERYDSIDALIHNAGALSRVYTVTPAGVETTVAAQVLGPYVLTATVAPLLWRSAQATIVTVSSGGMYTQPFDLAHLEMRSGDYDGTVAYARAKRAQVVLADAWAVQFSAAGTASFSMHPGWVDTPGLAAGLPRFRALWRPLLRTPAEGADTAVWLAAGGPAAEASARGEVVPKSGFFHDRRERSVRRFPVLRPTVAGDTDALLRWCAARTGVGMPTPTVTLP